MSFILLRLYGLRAQEAATLEVDEVTFCSYDRGPDKGKMYCQLKMDFDKNHKLKFDSGGIPENYSKLKIRNNPEDEVLNFLQSSSFGLFTLLHRKLRVGCMSNLLL